jgi:CubicO group peptidase (beta-lactamase class C family)
VRLDAVIVEIVSGEPFQDFVSANVFSPAGMRSSGFWPDIGESFSPPMLSMPVGAAAEPNWGFRGGTGMRASVRDLHRWTRALDEGRVLRPESVALLYGPHLTVSDGDGVGFGWFWSDSADGRWLWTRGSEDYGPNVILYRRAGTLLTIIAATNFGPAEAEGPGWSRRVRDALMPIYDAGACT